MVLVERVGALFVDVDLITIEGGERVSPSGSVATGPPNASLSGASLPVVLTVRASTITCDAGPGGR